MTTMPAAEASRPGTPHLARRNAAIRQPDALAHALGPAFGCTAGVIFALVYAFRHGRTGSTPTRLRVSFRRGGRWHGETGGRSGKAARRLLIGSVSAFGLLCAAWPLDSLVAYVAVGVFEHQGLLGTLKEGLLGGVVQGAVLGPVAGAAYALMLAFEAPIKIPQAPGPLELLRTDRVRALFQTAALAGVVCAYRHSGRERLDDRKVMCGILFVLYTGIPWRLLPRELGFGSGMTCWRSPRDWN